MKGWVHVDSKAERTMGHCSFGPHTHNWPSCSIHNLPHEYWEFVVLVLVDDPEETSTVIITDNSRERVGLEDISNPTHILELIRLATQTTWINSGWVGLNRIFQSQLETQPNSHYGLGSPSCRIIWVGLTLLHNNLNKNN